MKKIAIGFMVLCAVVPLVLAVSATAAEKFPSKRITYKICFNPGGESDITARFQEAALKKALGVDVAITYQVGGGGALCWAELVKTNPDGYTIAGHNLPHTVLQPLEMGNAGYNTLDLKQIYFFESTPNVLLVRSDSPYKTLADFVEAAKKQPPGVFTVGGSGSSSANDLGTTMFNKAAGIKLTYIPFGGTGSAVPSLLGSHVTALMSYSTMAVQHKGRFRAPATATDIGSGETLPVGMNGEVFLTGLPDAGTRLRIEVDGKGCEIEVKPEGDDPVLDLGPYRCPNGS